MHDLQGDNDFKRDLHTHHDREVMDQHGWRWLVREPMERPMVQPMVQPMERRPKVPTRLLSMMDHMGHRHEHP